LFEVIDYEMQREQFRVLPALDDSALTAK